MRQMHCVFLNQRGIKSLSTTAIREDKQEKGSSRSPAAAAATSIRPPSIWSNATMEPNSNSPFAKAEAHSSPNLLGKSSATPGDPERSRREPESASAPGSPLPSQSAAVQPSSAAARKHLPPTRATAASCVITPIWVVTRVSVKITIWRHHFISRTTFLNEANVLPCSRKLVEVTQMLLTLLPSLLSACCSCGPNLTQYATSCVRCRGSVSYFFEESEASFSFVFSLT